MYDYDLLFESVGIFFSVTDVKKRYIVLVMNYKVVPRDTKADLIELVGTV